MPNGWNNAGEGLEDDKERDEVDFKWREGMMEKRCVKLKTERGK